MLLVVLVMMDGVVLVFSYLLVTVMWSVICVSLDVGTNIFYL